MILRMNFLHFMIILHSITLVNLMCTAAPAYDSGYNTMKYDTLKDVVSRTITVDKSGQGNFTTVQQAIDSVPNDNRFWVRIRVKAGIYTEKVSIKEDKQYIVLEGESSHTTVISGDAGGNAIEDATFKMLADNFVARDISFENTYNLGAKNKGRKVTWAPAALIVGDKASFYHCGFVGFQDTLTDARGRHYFDSCYVEGAVDFIWGNGQSFYQKCVLNVTGWVGGTNNTGSAYITAQGRETANEYSGFVFAMSSVVGTGPAMLGRAYRKYSRVLYYNTHMDDIISPQGWDSWFNAGHEDLITFAEVGCDGPGANTSGRVKWEKQLPVQDLNKLININSFINQDGWLQKQP